MRPRYLLAAGFVAIAAGVSACIQARAPVTVVITIVAPTEQFGTYVPVAVVPATITPQFAITATAVPATIAAAAPTNSPPAVTPQLPSTTAAPVTLSPVATTAPPTAAPAATSTVVPAFSASNPAVTRDNDVTGPVDTTTVSYGLQQVSSGISQPVAVTHAADGSNRLFIATQAGKILVFDNGVMAGAPFLDISQKVIEPGNEQGFLNLAFHPDFAANGLFYVYYVTPELNAVVERYTVSADRNVADAASGRVLLSVPQTDGTHNGGGFAFGPFDHYLYIGAGDGGGHHDPENYAQRTDALQGKVLRLDVDGGDPYAVPQSNPFLTRSDGSLPEIWAMGLRNPWRITFDRARGDLWISDVGEENTEEVNFQQVFKGAGDNFGWSLMEGFSCYLGRPCESVSGLTPPLWRYWHEEQRCAIIGGYVYRGPSLPGLTGAYLFGDFCTGEIWAMRFNAAGDGFDRSRLLRSGLNITSFGEDESGEVYVVTLDGSLYRLTAN
ncbi:MAG: PQQ-dependent sugar dehydrogenase [Anaerolineales bacterium]